MQCCVRFYTHCCVRFCRQEHAQSQSIPSQFGMAAKFINIFIHIVILGNDGSHDGVGARVKHGIYKNKFVYEKPISVSSRCICKDMATAAEVILVCTWYVSGPSSLIYTRHACIATQIILLNNSFIFG